MRVSIFILMLLISAVFSAFSGRTGLNIIKDGPTDLKEPLQDSLKFKESNINTQKNKTPEDGPKKEVSDDDLKQRPFNKKKSDAKPVNEINRNKTIITNALPVDFDLNRCKSSVRLKVEDNKNKGINLMNGVVLAYDGENKNFTSAEKCQNYVLKLRQEGHFIKAEWKGNGKVSLYFDIEFDKERIEEILTGYGLDIQLTDEYYDTLYP